MGRNSAKETPPKPQLRNLCWSPIEQQMSSKLFQNCLSAGQRLSSWALTTSPTRWSRERSKSPKSVLRSAQQSASESKICSAVWVQDLLSAALISHLPPLCSHQRSPTDWLRGGRVFSVSLRWLENSCNHSKLKDSLKNVQLLFIHNRLNEVARLPTLIDWLRGKVSSQSRCSDLKTVLIYHHSKLIMSNKNSFQEERSFVADQQTEVRISGFDKKGSLLLSLL